MCLVAFGMQHKPDSYAAMMMLDVHRFDFSLLNNAFFRYYYYCTQSQYWNNFSTSLRLRNFSTGFGS